MARSISSVTNSSSRCAIPIKSANNLKSTTNQTKLNIKPRSGPVEKRKRLAANARERKRMDLLNKAFDQLRGRLNDARNKSKYDVLVQAKEYIQALARICADYDRDNPQDANAIASGRSLKITHDCDSQRPLEPKLESQIEIKARQQLNLTIRNVAPINWQQPIESPTSSSDCCLSPMSLPESLGSSGSPRCSAYPQQSFHQNFSKVYANHLVDNKTSFSHQTQRQIKQEPKSEIPNDYHQTYHPHYHSLWQAQKQGPIN